MPTDTIRARRFPNLPAAMNGAVMAGHIQRLLFDGTGLAVDDLVAPKVIVEQTCRVQYPIRVRGQAGSSHEVLVLGRMFADGSAAAAFEQSRLAPLASRCGASGTGAAPRTAVVEPLGLALSVFPVCDDLPTLVEVTEPDRMAGVLAEAPVDVELVRFTRTPRCVLRYRVGCPAHSVFGKVAADLAPRSAEVLKALASLASADIAVPTLLGEVPELQLAVFAELPGVRPRVSSASAVRSVVGMAARAASAIHRLSVEVPSRRPLAAEVARAIDAIASITDDAPALAARLSGAVDVVHARRLQTAGGSLRFAHGDFTPSQLLVTESSVGVLDVDDMCQAEPALDLGRFAAYVAVGLEKSGTAPDDGLEEYLVGEYQRAGGVPTSAERIRLYEALSLTVMAVHSWQRWKPKRLQAVCAVLDRLLPVDPTG